MDYLNQTAFPSQAFEAIDQHGETFHVFVLRQTYDLTPHGLVAGDEQEALCDRDIFFGAVNASGVRQESDFCPYKPRCDIIVNAAAHAPSGTPVIRFEVGLDVRRPPAFSTTPPESGECLIHKTLFVTGERRFRERSSPLRLMANAATSLTFGIRRFPTWRVTAPQPFSTLPLRYEFSFGGENRIDAGTLSKRGAKRIEKAFLLTPAQRTAHPDADETGNGAPLAHSAYDGNPLGCGFVQAWYLKAMRCKTVAAPRIEYGDDAITARRFCAALDGGSMPPPAGFGIVGRTWLPRVTLVGETAPANEHTTLPRDFDHGYWNAAPADQQCEHLRGDEQFTLLNLCPANHPAASRDAAGRTVLRFVLPEVAPELALSDTSGAFGAKAMALDTVIIDTQTDRVVLVWRAAIPAAARLARVHLRRADARAPHAEALHVA
jgi:hypothetical protein